MLTTQPYLYGTSPSTQVTNSTGCATCVSTPINTCPTTEYLSWVDSCSTTCTPNNTPIIEKEWIDIYLRDNFKYGWRIIDPNSGMQDLALIPQYLMQFCPPQTQPGSRGNKMGCPFCIPGTQGNWQQYLKVIGTRAYQYIKNLQTGEERAGGDWDFGIHDCAIASLDADKLINYCSLFKKVAEPINNYFDLQTGGLATGFRTLPIVVSQIDPCGDGGCRLMAIQKCSDVRACVIPSLVTQKGQLWDYNPVTDALPIFKPENLDCLVNVCIDGTTIRPAIPGQTSQGGVTKGGAGERTGGTVLTGFTYTDNINITGSGTPTSPVALKCTDIGLGIPGISNTNSLCEFLTLEKAVLLAATDPYLIDNTSSISISPNGTPTTVTGALNNWGVSTNFPKAVAVPRPAPIGYKWVLNIVSHINYLGATASPTSGSVGFGISVNSNSLTISGQDNQAIEQFGPNISVNGDINATGIYDVPQSGSFIIGVLVGVRYAVGDTATKPTITIGEISYTAKFELVRTI